MTPVSSAQRQDTPASTISVSSTRSFYLAIGLLACSGLALTLTLGVSIGIGVSVGLLLCYGAFWLWTRNPPHRTSPPLTPQIEETEPQPPLQWMDNLRHWIEESAKTTERRAWHKMAEFWSAHPEALAPGGMLWCAKQSLAELVT